jgi:hypothetical protein
MTVPAQRHVLKERRTLWLQELLPAMRDSLPDDAPLHVNVCELVADYLEDPQLVRKTFLPMVTEPQDGEIFPTTINKFGGQRYNTSCCCLCLPPSLRIAMTAAGSGSAAVSVLLPSYPYLQSKEEWPACGQCGPGSALTFMVQLRVCDFPEPVRPSLTPLDAMGSTLFQFFYCKHCSHRFENCDRLLRWVQPTYQDLKRCLLDL